ncbi:MAG: 30S ribosomal protein S5 [Patescibacteria group bacterium]
MAKQKAAGSRDIHERRSEAREEKEFESKTVELARVTRVTKGGKRMRFRSVILIGDKKGRVGFGVAKGADVAISINKSTRKAKKNLFTIPLINDTIPHAVAAKFGAARVLVKPAPRGAGIKAGGALRLVMELAGVPNVVGKLLGSKNKINNIKATFEALKKLRIKKTEKSEVRNPLSINSGSRAESREKSETNLNTQIK